MEGYEAFKALRSNTGLSIRKFAAISNVSPRILTYYESGEKSLLYMSVEKAICFFSILDTSIPNFFYTYYPIKDEVKSAMEKWDSQQKKETDRDKIRTRIKNRIYKMKERGALGDPAIKRIMSEYEKQMHMMLQELGDRRELTDEEYAQFISPVLHMIRKESQGNSENPVVNAIYNTEYSIHDVAEMIGISRQHLKANLNRNELKKMHIGTTLKLCCIIGVDFDELFDRSEIETLKIINK